MPRDSGFVVFCPPGSFPFWTPSSSPSLVAPRAAASPGQTLCVLKYFFFFFQPVRTLQGLQSWGRGRPPGSRKPLLRRAYSCFLNLAKFPLTTTAVVLSTWTAASFPLNCGHAAWPSLAQLSETPPVLTQLLLLSCYQLNPRTALRNKQGARKWMSQPVMSMGT